MRQATTHHGTADDEALRARLRALEDRHELEELVSRLGRWLDRGGADDGEAEEILAADIAVRTLGGTASGRAAVVAQARRTHAAHRTQHLIANVSPAVEAGGRRARIEANLLVVFADADGPAPAGPGFALGERYAFEAVRDEAGWRLARIEIEPLWRVDR